MYVTPLYTVMPNNEGFKALKHFLTNVLLKNIVWKPYFIWLNWFSCSTCRKKYSQNFKILRSDPKTERIFPLPPFVSFKRDKNIGNFLVWSAFKSDNQPRSFISTRTQYKLVLLFLTWLKITWLRSQDQIDSSNSLTTLQGSP